MSPYSDPIFTAERDPRQPGWHVTVHWPWGTRTAVRHFETEEEALSWIDRQSVDWLYGQGRTNRATAPEE